MPVYAFKQNFRNLIDCHYKGQEKVELSAFPSGTSAVNDIISILQICRIKVTQAVERY